MDRTRLTALLEEPGRIAVQDLAALRELAERHPWFSGAQVLLATGEQAMGDVMAGEHLRDAAAHVPSREVLFDLAERSQVGVPTPQLSVVRDEQPQAVGSSEAPPSSPLFERKVDPAPRMPLSDTEIAERILEQQMLEAAIATGYSLEAMVVEPIQEPPPPTRIPAVVDPEPVVVKVVTEEPTRPATRARMRFTDWLHTAAEVAEPTIPFEALDHGDAHDWIQQPEHDASGERVDPPLTSDGASTAIWQLATGNSPTRTRDTIDRFLKSETPEPPRRTEFYTPQEAGRRSLREQADMVTETLARIYEQQGNFAKAAEAYRKLALKVPEKAAYFAALSQVAAEKQKKEG